MSYIVDSAEGPEKAKWAEDVLEFADPFIGSGGTGHTTPAAAYPFGMVQPGPDTSHSGWEHCSAYQYGDKRIRRFSQNHLSGTGCSEFTDLGFNGSGGRKFGNGETPDRAIDGDVETKWLDFRAEHNAKPSLRAAVWLQFKFASPTELSGYRWYTANDFEDRDPGAWRLLGSNDGANWVMIDQVTGFRATSERNKLAFSRRLPEVK